MSPEEIESRLFVASSDQYGDRYIEHLLEQYKIYIGAADAISDRRQKANEFFLALNSTLVAVLGFVSLSLEKAETFYIVAMAAIAGSTICYFWYRLVRSYKGLNSGKFGVIHAIERRLPMALYDTEWEILGRGKNKDVYWPFTHIELRVPWVFFTLYVGLLAASVPWKTVFDAACSMGQQV